MTQISLFWFIKFCFKIGTEKQNRKSQLKVIYFIFYYYYYFVPNEIKILRSLSKIFTFIQLLISLNTKNSLKKSNLMEFKTKNKFLFRVYINAK